MTVATLASPRRLVAVRGFLYLIVESLKAEPLPESLPDSIFSSQACSSSQASLSQRPALNACGGLNMLQETMGFLRKARRCAMCDVLSWLLNLCQ